MEILKIIIDDKLYPSTMSTDIVSIFHIEYCGNCFPDKDWTDFTEPLLNMWTYNLVKNEYINNVDFILYFMDGSYRMDVFKDDSMRLEIKCINSRREEVVEYSFEYDYYEFLKELRKAIKKFNYILYKKQMHIGKFESVYKQTIISTKELTEVIKRKTER